MGGEQLTNGEANLNDNKRQLDPETHPQHSMLPEMDPQPLILPADEHRADNIPNDKARQELAMALGIPVRVPDGQANQPDRARDRRQDTQNRQRLLQHGLVLRQAALMPQPPLTHEREVEEHGRDRRAGDEERLQAEGAHVGDVGDGLAVGHGGVFRAAGRAPHDQHGDQHADPHAGGDDGEDLRAEA
jgi:hypothetical protein